MTRKDFWWLSLPHVALEVACGIFLFIVVWKGLYK